MKKLQEADLLAAVEQACREATFAFTGLMAYVKSDEGAVVHHGGCTARIAYILGAKEASVRRRLHSLVQKGALLKHQYRKAGVIRWWPVGLYAKVSSTPGGST